VGTLGATGWHLPAFVVAGGLLVGGLLIFFGGLPDLSPAAPDSTPARVVNSTSCGSPEARDVVQIMVDGRPERIALDGCGYPVGTELQVELSRDGLLAQIAGTGEATGVLTKRLNLLLLALAGLAGALQTIIVVPRALDPRARPAR
jgi:hypothetical protein